MNEFLPYLLCISASLSAASQAASDTAIEYPTLSDDRLQVTLYAADPDIVTPIGAAVDDQGRFYVIESHTHNPPRNYAGPKGDVIKVFEGEREDGRFQKMSVFADEIFQAQALAFDKNGTLYCVCTREVLILHDEDGDGRSEARTRILHLDPYEKRGNPHGQMQGIAFSNDGWLYVGTGTTSDDWIGSDGKRLSVGPYWGGIICRCRPDGTHLERIAWGFWNPYSIAFDRHGRLLALDNDPDHRGPNRLLHIVRGGDYGFKRTYGRYGLHPYQAWDGELPGTLPMIAGIGEAPTAVLNANDAALPLDYRDTIICATWGEHNLTLFRPETIGASISASSEIMLQGQGHDNKTSPFRPSGLAASPIDGAIYVSDWMLIDYTTHLKGRIWKVSARPGVSTDPPRKPFSQQEATPELARLQNLTDASQIAEYPALRRALSETDPFIRNAAVTAMARPEFRTEVIQDLEHSDGRVRLGALLALRRADVPDPATTIEPRLADSDLEVVQMAMIWAGEKKLKALTGKIDEAAAKPDLTKAFFQTWLATMQIMEQSTSTDPAKTAGQVFKLRRQLSPEFIEQLVHNEDRPTALRAMALRWLQNLDTPANHEFLSEAARKSDPALQIEAIRRLGESALPEATAILRAIANDRSQPSAMRTEALVSLAGKPDVSLLALLDDSEPSVRLETARTLRQLGANPTVLDAAKRKLAEIVADEREPRLQSQLEFLLAPENTSHSGALRNWQEYFEKGGDPDAGRRVFFSENSACNACHAVDGRGIKLGSGSAVGFIAMPFGPDLTVIGRTANRDAIIRSIVNPSDSIAPEYQGWFVKMKNGETTFGREIDQETNAVQLITLDGQEHNFPRKDIESWGAMEHSLMPDDLPQLMAVEEFRDLIAYLSSLK